MDISKKLIINADDFGQSKIDNQQIIKTIQNNLINSASLMINYPLSNEALKFAKKHPSFDWGIHLEVASNLDWPQIVFKIFTFQLSIKEIIANFEKQIRKMIQGGLIPKHLDSHQHLHLLPQIFPRVLYLTHKYQITRIRFAKAIWPPPRGLWPGGPPHPFYWKKWLINYLINVNDGQNLLNISTTDYLADINWFSGGEFSLPTGSVEIITHPGKFALDTEKLKEIKKYA